MGAAVLIALALLAQSDAYSGRLQDRHTQAQVDPAVTTARRVESELRARVRFETDPATATVRIVVQGKGRRVSIAAFRHSATAWTVEQVELVPADGDYDRGTPIASRSEPSSQTTYALEGLLGRPGWSANCRGVDQTVMIVHDPFLDVDHVFKGCPGGAAGAILRLLDDNAPRGVG